MEGIQEYLEQWEEGENIDGRNVVGISGLPKLIMELTAFDESQ